MNLYFPQRLESDGANIVDSIVHQYNALLDGGSISIVDDVTTLTLPDRVWRLYLQSVSHITDVMLDPRIRRLTLCLIGKKIKGKKIIESPVQIRLSLLLNSRDQVLTRTVMSS